LAQLAQLDPDSAREEIRDIVNEIISIKAVVMSIAEQEHLLQDICNDVLGYGPLEPLLARDDISDIMVNGAGRVFIEVNGKVNLTSIRFRDNAQLMNICQRIVSQVGRRVDESSPICDARLLDGSRVNVIAPPLSLDGPTLTIRKFKKDKLKMDDLIRFGSINEAGGKLLGIIGRCRCNVLISGGTGSGKTTLLNCNNPMWCGWKPVRPISKARARSRCAISCATVCVCAPNASSSAKCAAPRRSISCRP
jgi:pilus assembly protein CpaF